MANTSAVYARVDTDLKSSAEEILSQFGISPSSAIQMFYSQIVLSKGAPFEIRFQRRKRPLVLEDMTNEELAAEVMKGYRSMEAGDVYSADEVDEELYREFGI